MAVAATSVKQVFNERPPARLNTTPNRSNSCLSTLFRISCPDLLVPQDSSDQKRSNPAGYVCASTFDQNPELQFDARRSLIGFEYQTKGQEKSLSHLLILSMNVVSSGLCVEV